eukprot:scpid86720/ scgid35030/ 
MAFICKKNMLALLVATCAVAMISGAPVQQSTGRCSNPSTKALLRQLDSFGSNTQSFSPWPLCVGTLRTKTRLVAAAMAAQREQQQSTVVAANSNQLDSDEEMNAILDTMEGCTAADVRNLMVNFPTASDPCQWTIKCRHDSNRFPATLYSAVEAEHSGAAAQMCQCRPIYRNVIVLRKHTATKSTCATWHMEFERVPIGFNCQRNVMVTNDFF